MLTVQAFYMHFPLECKLQVGKAAICPIHHCVLGTWGCALHYSKYVIKHVDLFISTSFPPPHFPG